MENKMTELVFILDESGSMFGLKCDTIGGFNSMIEQQKNIDGKCFVTTILFNHTRKLLHDRIDLEKIDLMTINDYQPNGSTALMDAVGHTIQHIANIHKYIRKEDVPSKTLFVIMTDGYENASTQFSKSMIHQLIETYKKNQGWEFMFIGANIDAEETAMSYGIEKAMAANYHADSKGSEVVYNAVNEVVTNLRKNRSIDKNWNRSIKKDYKDRK